jgi:hypothetical protein
MSSNKGSKIRFSINDDLMLLREVLAANPFENANEWNNIKKKLIKETTKKISRRAVREHTEHLLKLFKKSAQICESKFYNNSKTIGVPKHPIPPCLSYKP